MRRKLRNGRIVTNKISQIFHVINFVLEVPNKAPFDVLEGLFLLNGN